MPSRLRRYLTKSSPSHASIMDANQALLRAIGERAQESVSLASPCCMINFSARYRLIGGRGLKSVARAAPVSFRAFPGFRLGQM
jgi:hypothetical protein